MTPIRIPFRRPLRIGGTLVHERTSLLIRLRGEEGREGAAELALRPTADDEEARAIYRALLRRSVAADSPAQTALDAAAADLAAQRAGARLADTIGTVRRARVPVNALIDESDPEAAAARARACVAEGFCCLKLKVDPRDTAAEEGRLAAVRAAVGDAVRIRLDVNAAWTVAQALAALPRLAAYGLEYVEQPVAGIAALAEVRRACAVPIAADESITGPADVAAVAAHGAADVVVVKPALLGLRTAAAVVAAAAAHELPVVVTSTLDTSVGIALALQVAALVPGRLLACGLATASLLAGDVVAHPLVPHDGTLPVPPGPGLGVRLDESAVRRWQVEL